MDHEARHMSAQLDRTVNAPREARGMVQSLVDGALSPFVQDALLLTSELVTNAVIHTHVSCDLDATYERADHRLVVRVRDQSSLTPEDRPSSEAAAAEGRGLQLIDALATSWGCNETTQGKEMWFELVE